MNHPLSVNWYSVLIVTHHRKKSALVVLLCVAITFAMFYALYGLLLPSTQEQQNKIRQILHTPAAQISSVVFSPHPNGAFPSLVHSPVIVTNRADIDLFAEKLAKAQSFSPNHPGGKWYVKVKLITSSGNIEFMVTRSFDSENGVFIMIMSNVSDGWNIGDFRNDELGSAIEEMIAREAVYRAAIR